MPNGYVGYLPASSSNYVMVTGTNSVWNSATWLELGYAGPGNSLVISNGGWVVAANAKVGDASTSTGNTALITGAGSVWSNTGICTIGSSGSKNKVTINKGGRLVPISPCSAPGVRPPTLGSGFGQQFGLG